MIEQEKLDSILKDIMRGWGIPGLGVGLVRAGEIVYAKGFGVQSLDTGTPVTEESIFGVASVSKCFVASAILQLCERGLIHLDDPLILHLPDFRLADERYPLITIRQMLSHTSGMPDMDEYEYVELVSHPESDEGAAERYMRSLSDRKMVAAPGEIFYYSNIAYNVLGVLITRITRQSFEAYMEEHILLPAGMPDSTFFYPEVDPKRLAVPHLRSPRMVVNPVYPYHRADAPASFLHSTVIDMCHWAQTCLNRGIYTGQRILTEASYDLMWTPVAPRGYPPFYESTGLGWTLGHYEGLLTVSHGGGGFGWTDFLLLLPEIQSALVILCNEESSARSRTIRAALHCLLDRDPEVGKVSWMIPINQALCEGGIQAAYARYKALKDTGDENYCFDEDELISLTYQLMNVNNLDLTIEVLKLNLHVYPRHLESYTRLADCYLRKNEIRPAVQCLQQALEIDSNCTEASEKLKKILHKTNPQS